MPIDLLIFKIIHLYSVMLFVGSIFFITYVIDVIKHNSDKSEYKLFGPKITARARKLMFVNIGFLVFSGGYILFKYYDISLIGTIMSLKLFLAVCIIVIFITADWIVEKTNHIHWFHHFFHHAVIALMASVVILSQIM
ncbi:hypothetical protein ACKGJI_06990 [Sulfurospirillum sp. 1307]|jgi:hypothetical protein